jgi:photosystem II stability/assembly factor-like uncharacterized protein
MKTIKIFSLLIFIILNQQICYPQFTQKNNGIDGGDIACFANSTGVIYAGTMYGGIYKSTNSGSNWVSINNDIGNYYTGCLAVSGGRIYAGCVQAPLLGNGGFVDHDYLFRSINGGSNWEVIQNGIPYNGMSAYSLMIKDNLIFAGTNYGVYIAQDSSVIVWKKQGNLNRVTNCLVSNENYIFAGTIEYGIYRSPDLGNSWETVNTGLGNNNVGAFCIKNNKIFAGTDNGIYATTNNGNEWYGVNNGLGSLSINSLTVFNNNLYAGTYGGIYLSTNEGVNWTAIDGGNFSENAFFALYYDGTSLFAGASSYYSGVYKTTNNGTNWQKSDNGILAPCLWGITTAGNYMFATFYGQGVFKSTNWGESWEAVNSGINSPYVRQIITKDNNIFVKNLARVLKSTNYGISWESVSGGLESVNYLMSLYTDGTDLYAGSFYTGLFKSTNNGANWFSLGLQNGDIRAIKKKGNMLFAGTDTEGMYVTTNEGANWIEINNGLPITYFLHARALENMGDNIFLGSVFRGGLYKTTNNGTNWILGNNGIYDSVVFALTVKDSILYASDYTDGLYITKNLGNTWKYKGEGLYKKDVRSICIAGGYVFVACNGFGVWRRPLYEVISVRQISTEIPERTEMDQNFPNPFNPVTSIKYYIPSNLKRQSSIIRLVVYDILGKEITTLVNNKQKPGSYEVQFNGEELSSGIYFYSLFVDGVRAETRKMLLLK